MNCLISMKTVSLHFLSAINISIIALNTDNIFSNFLNF